MTKIVHISDTHRYHRDLVIEPCDILIHSGDITNKGEWTSTIDFFDWLNEQPARHKIFIAGNHDFNFDYSWKAYTPQGKMRHHPKPITKEEIDEKLKDYPNIVYLNDSGVTVEGLNIWGSPITPWFHDWAFNRNRGSEIKKHWDIIPDNTNILITHGPPFGIMDKCRDGSVVGCQDLADKINELMHIRLVCFGHIHEGYGIVEKRNRFFPEEQIIYSNGSVLNEYYDLTNKPNVFEL